jgi:HPt (histidine-containing phosphotransfer) domain-containing protein
LRERSDRHREPILRISTLAPEQIATETVYAPAIDLGVLAQLAAMQRDGRPGFMERIITLFLLTAPRLINDLEAASKADEITALRRASHSLRPCSATVGALSLATLCESLETMARSGSVRNSAVKVAAIAQEYRRVEVALTGSSVIS